MWHSGVLSGLVKECLSQILAQTTATPNPCILRIDYNAHQLRLCGDFWGCETKFAHTFAFCSAGCYIYFCCDSVAQWIRALPCGGRGRAFESRQGHQFKKADDAKRHPFFKSLGKVAEWLNVLVSKTSRVQALESSNLSLPATRKGLGHSHHMRLYGAFHYPSRRTT